MAPELRSSTSATEACGTSEFNWFDRPRRVGHRDAVAAVHAGATTLRKKPLPLRRIATSVGRFSRRCGAASSGDWFMSVPLSDAGPGYGSAAPARRRGGGVAAARPAGQTPGVPD